MLKRSEPTPRFQIDDDIPVPSRGWGRPWHLMKHGQSHLVVWSAADKKRLTRGKGQHAAVQSARKWLKEHRPTWKLVCRREGDATRIWFVNPDVGDINA